MNNNYDIIHNIELLNKGLPTKFLDLGIKEELKRKLKKNSYLIYYPYPDSEKVIYYNKIEPEICLLEIITKEELEHRKILGSIFSLGVESSTFGDIVIYNNHYYFYVLEEMKDYFMNNLINIGKINVRLEERDLDLLKDYKREYDDIELIVSSERIDTIISRLIGINRTKIKKLINDKDILLNNNLLKETSKKLNKDDLFSIRKYGKYKYNGIIKNTKSGNIIVNIKKYK